MSSGVFNQFTGHHNRRSIRLRNWDYSRPGVYFITVCAHDHHEQFFGNVKNGEMELNEYGNIVRIGILMKRTLPTHRRDTWRC
jgi:putative transposase